MELEDLQEGGGDLKRRRVEEGSEPAAESGSAATGIPSGLKIRLSLSSDGNASRGKDKEGDDGAGGDAVQRRGGATLGSEQPAAPLAQIGVRVVGPNEAAQGPRSGSLKLGNLSHGQHEEVQAGGGEAGGGDVATQGVSGTTTPPTHEAYRIPSHAGWFRWDAVHTTEQRLFPEFFSSASPSKTPKVYQEYRNAIISRYRENPGRLLTFTEIRRLLLGDVNTLRRIFEFLDHWGLINYHARMEGSQKAPSKWLAMAPALVEADPLRGGDLRIVAPAIDSPTSSLLRLKPESSKTGAAAQPGKTPGGAASVAGSGTGERGAGIGGGSALTRLGAGLGSRQETFSSAAAEQAVATAAGVMSGAVPFHCDSCKRDCTRLRFHCQTRADFDLCSECLADGLFPQNLSITDFVKMEGGEAATSVAAGEEEGEEGAAWSGEETLLLLEGLELYGDNWAEIAEHVGSRTRAQCILHFIRMPIEDPFLEDMADGRTGTAAVAPGGGEVKATVAAAGANGKTSHVSAATPDLSSGKAAGKGEGGVAEQKPMVLDGRVVRDGEGKEKAEGAAAAGVGGERGAAGSGVAEGELWRADDGLSTPFADAANPILAQVAFLAAMVGPRVAAAAARAALAALAEEEPAVEDALAAAAAAEGAGEAAGNAEASGTAVGAGEAVKMETDEERPQGGEATASDPAAAFSTARIRAAAATALGAAAAKAKLLATQEEREMQELVAAVVEKQLRKVELKLQHFDELEGMLAHEKEQVERQRQEVYAERIKLAAARASPQVASQTAPPTPATFPPSTNPGSAPQPPSPLSGPLGANTPQTVKAPSPFLTT
eukprot:TRINITY_DN19445_c0_g1_i1.p1 TRINITY_DN19445_c0_g1~~TRINITY_DN19445_c0_g1_i1.p1  ORF type:complete len:829 (+),score=231.07 TRINITY_DN19445_c0_g1_i1:688-3174(+)